jgi:hypothetical protein
LKLNRFLYLTKITNVREGVERFRDARVLAALGNRFWTPAPERSSVQWIRRDDALGIPLRLLELKALEVYRPIFNLLPGFSSNRLDLELVGPRCRLVRSQLDLPMNSRFFWTGVHGPSGSRARRGG